MCQFAECSFLAPTLSLSCTYLTTSAANLWTDRPFQTVTTLKLQLQQEKEDLSEKLEGKTLINISLSSLLLNVSFSKPNRWVSPKPVFHSPWPDVSTAFVERARCKKVSYIVLPKELIIHWYKVRSQGE